MSAATISFQDELTGMLKQFQSVPKPEPLVRLLASLRHEMEVPAAPSSGPSFRTGHPAAAKKDTTPQLEAPVPIRSFGSTATATAGGAAAVPAWRSGVTNTMKKVNSNETFQSIHKSNSNGSLASSGSAGKSPRTPMTPFSTGGAAASANMLSTGASGRYQSRFVTKGNIEEKILNTIIGNKLNAFTPVTYNDTRDFIYQILDSGEIEFIKEFVEKVFLKATVEELYCGLFAKLLAEIAHRYPVMYEEMNRYHSEFLHVFDDVEEGTMDESSLKKRQYRMGYGQFISELASRNALPKGDLLIIIQKVSQGIQEQSVKDMKTKVVDEYIDCLIRLLENLLEHSPAFYKAVQGDVEACLMPVIDPLIKKTAGDRPSLSSKSWYRLKDLRDLLV